MGIKRIEGEDRERYLDHHGCACRTCGFTEDGLVVLQNECGDISVHCVECLDQTEQPESSDLMMVSLPEMPVAAFSHYVRMLAFVTFAAKVGALDNHDFSSGSLPPRFRTSEAWTLPIRFKTLAEGLELSDIDPNTKRDLAFAKRAFDFLKGRIEYTERLHGNATLSDMIKTKGTEVKSTFRAMAPGIEIDRIRSWGNPGSSFRLIGRT